MSLPDVPLLIITLADDQTSTLDPLALKIPAIRAYNKQLIDEISVSVDDELAIEQEFHDFWAFGRNYSTGLKGFFPQCIQTPFYSISMLQRQSFIIPFSAFRAHGQQNTLICIPCVLWALRRTTSTNQYESRIIYN
jgi:hypothetical protein